MLRDERTVINLVCPSLVRVEVLRTQLSHFSFGRSGIGIGIRFPEHDMKGKGRKIDEVWHLHRSRYFDPSLMSSCRDTNIHETSALARLSGADGITKSQHVANRHPGG